MPKPQNIDAPIVMVDHASLTRFSEDSAYKSECPICPNGVLLIYRENGVLQRHDRCVSCGQQVFYLDEAINGEPLAPFKRTPDSSEIS